MHPAGTTEASGTAQPPSTPPPSATSQPAAPDTSERRDPTYDEAARILRMRCKDFIWEIDFLHEIAGKVAPLTNEQMVKMSMAMFMVQENLKADELARLTKDFSRTLREVYGACAEKPEQKYYLETLAPALKSQLGR